MSVGTWGVGLYDDDDARDLKGSLALLSKIPLLGDDLLQLVLRQNEGGPALTDDGGPTFWLVVADQFERRGIHSPMAFARALEAIDGGHDIDDLRARGLDDKGVKKREKVLAQLSERLRTPRPARKIPATPRPPDAVVQTGEVYAFPTMAGRLFGQGIRSAEDLDPSKFVPDGWGAILVIEQGRAYDWLPWCAIASVAVEPSRLPALEDVVGVETIFNGQANGATRVVPKRADFKAHKFQLIGRLEIDAGAASPLIPPWPNIEQTIDFGWSITTASFGANSPVVRPRGPVVSTLLA